MYQRVSMSIDVHEAGGCMKEQAHTLLGIRRRYQRRGNRTRQPGLVQRDIAYLMDAACLDEQETPGAR